MNVPVVIATGVATRAGGSRRLLRRHHRGRSRLDGVLAVFGGPRPLRRGAGHVRRPQRAKAAIAAVLPRASCQGCRVHFSRNLLTRVPKASQGMVATLVRTIFAQPDHDSVWDQHARVVDQLSGRFDDAEAMLADAAEDLLAFSTLPASHWSARRSNNPQERLNKEVRRRTDVVGIFPNRGAVVRLVGAVLSGQNDSGRWPNATWAQRAWPRPACAPLGAKHP